MKTGFILLLFLVPAVVIAQDYTPVFKNHECSYYMQQLANEYNTDITCGYLHVPENRNAIDNSLELELFVVWIKAIEATGKAPVIYLEGGPGGAASALFDDWLESDLRLTYDIILIDQRGTGLSYPSLNCPEYDETEDDSWLVACRERLVDEEGIDLNAYHSANNAHDIHDLLIALNIAEANIYGSSYGSRLALTIVRDFPERVRTLILDAIYPPHVDSLVTQAYYGNQALEQLFTDCSEDSICNTAYPDLRQSFYVTIENMNANPPEIDDYELGMVYEMNGDDFVNHVYNLLYDTQMLPFLPALIDAYAKGEYDYDPQVDVEQVALEQAITSGTIVPDEYDRAAMVYLDIADVDDLYAYYFSISDDEFDALYTELDDYIYYMPFLEYLGLDTMGETIDYMEALDDDDYYDLEIEVSGYYDDDSEGMYMSVECAEEIHFYDEADVLIGKSGLPEQVASALSETAIDSFDECAIWDVEESADMENEPVISDIPSLIFSGVYDPVTPQQWGEQTQTYLTNSWHYILPNVGHGALNIEDCATTIALAFLETPFQQPDVSCLDRLGKPAFFIRQ